MQMIMISLSALALGLAGAAYAQEGMPSGDPLGDKTVTKAEFQAKGAAMFDKMDVNHDGKLDAADRVAHEGQMFDQADANHDGALSRDEVTAAHQHGAAGDGLGSAEKHRGGPEGGHGGMILLKMADTNKDGAVSRDEFLAAHAQHFDMMDTNHDGQVTQAERKAAREKMHAQGGVGGGMRHGKHGDHKMGDMPPPPAPAN